MKKCLTLTLFILALCTTNVANAEAPKLQTKSPVIYLADNLDEADNLGWCIDTKGRGFSEILHVHSCKPQGGDVQFNYDNESGQIRSVAFENKCMELTMASNNEPFGLLDCNSNSAAQKFNYNKQTMQIGLGTGGSDCVSVGENSSSAGPFMSRTLVVVKCDQAKPMFSQWIVKN